MLAESSSRAMAVPCLFILMLPRESSAAHCSKEMSSQDVNQLEGRCPGRGPGPQRCLQHSVDTEGAFCVEPRPGLPSTRAATFSCKGPESNYFSSGALEHLSQPLSTAVLVGKQQRQDKNGRGCASAKLHLQNRGWHRFGPHLQPPILTQ